LKTQVCFSQHTKKSSEKTLVKSVAIKTLKWYLNKYGCNENCKGFKYISATEGDSLDPHRINLKEATLFFSYLLERKIFTKKFTTDLLVYFKKCDSNFIAVKQYYSISLVFESNIITKDLDDTAVRENINKSIISSYLEKGKTIYISLNFPNNGYPHTFVLTK